jgi:hypothetical protein
MVLLLVYSPGVYMAGRGEPDRVCCCAGRVRLKLRMDTAWVLLLQDWHRL